MPKSPPNALIQAYDKLDAETRRLFMKFGLFLVLLSAITPMIAGIWFNFEPAWWMMDATIFVVGICMIWPPLAIWAVMAIPSALAKIVPSKRLAEAVMPSRRSESRSEDGVWGDDERARRLEEEG